MTTTRLVVLVVAALGAALAVTWFAGGDGPETPAGGTAEEAVQPEAVDALLVVFPSVHNRFRHAPCNLVPGDGLSSFSTVIKASRQNADHVLAVSLGDLCTLRGPLGQHTTSRILREFLGPIGVQVVVAGTSELQHGSEYARVALSGVPDLHVLCGNAHDATGRTVLRGWSAATTTDEDGLAGRTVLFVGVAGTSIAADLAEAGSDIRIADPVPVVRQALVDAAARIERMERVADLRVLLVHGTADEAAAILEEVPGFDLAAVADGPPLPPPEPRRAAGVPILYPGADARFVGRADVKGAGPARFVFYVHRLGRDLLTRGDRSREVLRQLIAELSLTARQAMTVADDIRPPDPRGDYAGAAACTDCHPEVAERHEGSAHRVPPRGWGVGATDGNPQCLPCHVTAPDWLGGYRGPADTGPMRGVSCESCHGPGAAHSAMPAPGYGAVRWEICTNCHTPEHSPGFDAEGAWDRTGHGPR